MIAFKVWFKGNVNSFIDLGGSANVSKSRDRDKEYKNWTFIHIPNLILSIRICI